MIKCNKENEKEILEYIGKDYGQCLYLYMDLLKYGFENENIHVWLQKKDEKITALVLQYYTGVHVFSKERDLDVLDVVELLKEIKPTLICGMKWTLEKIEGYLPDYEPEIGVVAQLKDLKEFDIEGCYCANEEEIKEVAYFLKDDEELGKPYGFDLLYKQLLERFKENFGRTFILREGGDKEGKIVSTISSYAEQGGAAVLSGALVDIDHRGKGLSKRTMSAICKQLKDEGVDVFSYYYIPSAEGMHKAIGFEPIGEWQKLIRVDK